MFFHETDDLNESNKALDFPKAIKSTIPDDLISIVNDGNHLCIGISDASQDSVTAYKQAYLRALMMAALQKKCTINMLSEDFTSDKDPKEKIISRFQDLYTINTQIAIIDSLPVIRSFQLSSGEMIVLVSLPQNGSSDSDLKYQESSFRDKNSSDRISQNKMTDPYNPQVDNTNLKDSTAISPNISIKYPFDLKVSCTLFHQENVAVRSQQIFRTKYEIRNCDTSSLYPGREQFGFTSVNGRWVDFSTKFNSNEIPRENIRFFYQTSGQNTTPSDSSVNSPIGMTTYEGLWPALVTGLLWQLANIVSGDSQKVKHLNENYNQTYNEINRTVDKRKISCDLRRLIFTDDRLYTVLHLN